MYLSFLSVQQLYLGLNVQGLILMIWDLELMLYLTGVYSLKQISDENHHDSDKARKGYDYQIVNILLPAGRIIPHMRNFETKKINS